jgi:hypothetical protein
LVWFGAGSGGGGGEDVYGAFVIAMDAQTPALVSEISPLAPTVRHTPYV